MGRPIRKSVVTTCLCMCQTQHSVCVLQNEFVGATDRYWECASNWLTEDDFPVRHAPCGDDRAFFNTVCLSLGLMG